MYHEYMDIQQKKDLITYLSSYVTENKLTKMEQVVAHRTRHVTILLEDVFQSHNASAILRSAECFGIQDIHIIQNKFRFSATVGVAMGSSKWVRMYDYQTTANAYQELKKQGYRIVATSPHAQAYPLEKLP